MDFPCGSDCKEYACSVGSPGLISGLGRSLKEWLPIPIFLPGKSHEQRSLVDYSPWGRKESDTTNTFTFILFNAFMIQHNGFFFTFLCEDHMQVFNFFPEHYEHG